MHKERNVSLYLISPHHLIVVRDAVALLADDERAHGVRIERAVPIEDIVEKHLKLGIEFDNMHRLLNHPRSGPGHDPDILSEEPATADEAGLRRFLEGTVMPWFETRRKEIANRPLIREQAFGEALDPDNWKGSGATRCV
jgi:hypothetical protein